MYNNMRNPFMPQTPYSTGNNTWSSGSQGQTQTQGGLWNPQATYGGGSMGGYGGYGSPGGYSGMTGGMGGFGGTPGYAGMSGGGYGMPSYGMGGGMSRPSTMGNPLGGGGFGSSMGGNNNNLSTAPIGNNYGMDQVGPQFGPQVPPPNPGAYQQRTNPYMSIYGQGGTASNPYMSASGGGQPLGMSTINQPTGYNGGGPYGGFNPTQTPIGGDKAPQMSTPSYMNVNGGGAPVGQSSLTAQERQSGQFAPASTPTPLSDMTSRWLFGGAYGGNNGMQIMPDGSWRY